MDDVRGFSLIEVIVTVAIIAILSGLAVSSYRGFSARARQKEGFILASTYYSAANATRIEFGHYPGNFVQTGFQPAGRIGYRLFAGANTSINLPFDDPACLDTSHPCNCSGNCPNFKTWVDNGLESSGLGPAALAPYSTCGSHGSVATTDDTFSARISGQVLANAERDVYAFDHNKVFEMCSDGLK